MRLYASSSGTPINLSGYTFDGDICSASGEIIDSFVPTIVSATSGVVDLELTPAQTVAFEEGNYKYDVNATFPNGERYFWLQGAVTVSGTCSRE